MKKSSKEISIRDGRHSDSESNLSRHLSTCQLCSDSDRTCMIVQRLQAASGKDLSNSCLYNTANTMQHKQCSCISPLLSNWRFWE